MSGNAMPSDMPQRRKYVLIAGAILCAVLATTAMAWSQGIMINETPSFPQGIYQKYPREARVRRGQMVVACPPDEPMYHLALQRHYLRPGLCPSGTEPLIKKVVGLPGDTILVAAGLWLAAEGLMLALAPQQIERILAFLAGLPVENRRSLGLFALAAGVALIWLASRVAG